MANRTAGGGVLATIALDYAAPTGSLASMSQHGPVKISKDQHIGQTIKPFQVDKVKKVKKVER